jgi:carboxyl-terminal processing protease
MYKFASLFLRFISLNLIVLTIVPMKTDVIQQTTDGVRACRYVPGISVPAQMPVEVRAAATATPFPTLTPPAITPVDAETTTRQLQVFNGLWNAVNDHYVYSDFRGHDWSAVGSVYQQHIQNGLTDDAFYAVMQAVLTELGDGHSYYQSPAQVIEDEAAFAGQNNFVGVGGLFLPILSVNRAAVISVFPDSPAAEAGLLPHDSILSVDGGPIRDEHGSSRTRGPEGSVVVLTVQRPGEDARDVTLTRRRVAGALPIDACLVPNTRIAYILIPTFLDETIPDQIRAALTQMTADGALDGLILDNRVNGGGSGKVSQAVLSLFVGGQQGYFVSHDGREPLELQPEDIGGSQTVPMIILVDVDTVSYAEILSGVLRLAGRAQIVGGRTLGNVEQLHRYDFDDGSRAWIASATFEPLGQANGIWEDTGIIPDVIVPTRWDLFTEATDPALAKAVELLTPK